MSGNPTNIPHRAFTLIEVLFVLFIAVLLTAIGVPQLSKFMKTSRVQSTAKTVLSALTQARLDALRYKSTVGVFFGDDPAPHKAAGIWLSPLKDVLPKYGNIEIWTVDNYTVVSSGMFDYSDRGQNWKEDMFNASCTQPFDPLNPPDFKPANKAIPFYKTTNPLSPEPLTFVDGVRIISGTYVDGAGIRNFKWDQYGVNSLQYPAGKSAKCEIKRHNVVYTRNGSSPDNESNYSYRFILVYDVSTGDHVVIQCAEWKSLSRPKILVNSQGNYSLTHINGQKLLKLSDMNKMVGP